MSVLLYLLDGHHDGIHSLSGSLPFWSNNRACVRFGFYRASRVSTLSRDIDIAILSVRLSVCLSVRDVPVLDENGLTYCHSFIYHT